MSERGEKKLIYNRHELLSRGSRTLGWCFSAAECNGKRQNDRVQPQSGVHRSGKMLAKSSSQDRALKLCVLKKKLDTDCARHCIVPS
jgi:hypothetical protein